MNSTRGQTYDTFPIGHFFDTISRRGRMHRDIQMCNHASHPLAAL